jgi:hypothetical protein
MRRHGLSQGKATRNDKPPYPRKSSGGMKNHTGFCSKGLRPFPSAGAGEMQVKGLLQGKEKPKKTP